MSSAVIRKKLHQQIDDLPDDVVKQIADFTFAVSRFYRQGDHAECFQADTGEGSGEHGAFGLWSDYPEASQPAVFALKLRRQLETRQDVATNSPD